MSMSVLPGLVGALSTSLPAWFGLDSPGWHWHWVLLGFCGLAMALLGLQQHPLLHLVGLGFTSLALGLLGLLI